MNAGFEINNTCFADLEQRMLIRLGGMLVVMTAILLAGIRYMH